MADLEMALTDKEKWQALLRGQMSSTTVNKFVNMIRLLDQKAQMMILLNSILVPVCINAVEHGTFKVAAIISIVTSITSILSAMICIYPKRRYRKSGDRELNLLHFNDIGHMDKDDFLEQFMPVFNNLEKLAEAVVLDLYDTARHSIRPKFLWLKISYATFALGNITAIAVALIGLNEVS